MVYFSAPSFGGVLDIFAFERVDTFADLIFTCKEFHNKIDDVKKVLPPFVFLLYLGQRSVMCP